jgi:hypothetical protein
VTPSRLAFVNCLQNVTADTCNGLTPAPNHTKTEIGRSAKVSVLLTCLLDWRLPDEEMDWRELMARRLLVDFVGGEEAQSFREIYA